MKIVSASLQVVSDEARAMYNGGMAGLTYWSPNVNIFRDPRWGRGQETPGEDPLLASAYAVSYVKGLQQPYGYGENRLKVAACCKHYTAYDLDNWNGVDRFHFNAKVSLQDLEDTYNVPFQACVVEGKVASVMCSYNQVNGVPTCADPTLLQGVIRGLWGLNGYIVSDCDSVGVYYDTQHYTSTPEEAAADAIKAGLNLDCGPFLAVHTEAAVRQGLLKETDVNLALANILTVQMRLGMFNGEPATQPFGQLGPKDVCAPSHRELALEAAKQGIVLLKNDRQVLPLSPNRYRNIAVVGPNSDATITMIGNYAGGRLPVTWYPQEYVTNVAMTDMSMRADPARGYPGRTYRFYKGPVVYPFGHGLTYTSFVHELVGAPAAVSVPLGGRRHVNLHNHTTTMWGGAVRVSHAKCDDLAIQLHVDVKNSGGMDGAHTLLVYSSPPEGAWAPLKQLVAFRKVHVPAKSKTRVALGLHVCEHLSLVDRSGIRRIPIGEHRLYIGDVTHTFPVEVEAVRARGTQS